MKISRVIGVVVLPIILTALIPLLRYVTAYSNSVFALAVTCNIIPVCFAASALLRRDWSSAALYFVPLIAVILLRQASAPFSFLEEAGFRGELLLDGQHPRDCKPVAFFEGSEREEVGLCRSMTRGWNTYSDNILYDTGGEIMWPPQLRTQGWRNAMLSLPSGRLMEQPRVIARRIYGSYYDVLIGFEDIDKD